MTGAPLLVSCDRVRPPRISALWVTRVPARVTGDVPPAIAMERMLHTTLFLADAMMISQQSVISFRGLTGQVVKDTRGRSMSVCMPPAMAAAISMILLSSIPFPGPNAQCLVVLVRNASALCRGTVSWGTSWAPMAFSQKSISGSASMTRAACTRSCLTGSRFSPVKGSLIMTPSLKLVKCTRVLSRTTSCAGSRP